MAPALWVGAAVVAAGALIAAAFPFSTRASAGAQAAETANTAADGYPGELAELTA